MQNHSPLLIDFSCDTEELLALFSAFLKSSENLHLVASQAGGRESEVNYRAARYVCKLGPSDDATDSFKPIMTNGDRSGIQSSIAIGMGDMVKTDPPIPPVAAGLLNLGADICADLPANLVHWMPAELTSGPEFFLEAMREYGNGGAFPALPLVRFEESEGGAILTKGLHWFARQEVRFETEKLDEAAAVKRMVRILHDIVHNGPIAEAMQVAGLEAEEELRLLPKADGSLVEVQLA